jgi:iron complex outermembrane recepter protein
MFLLQLNNEIIDMKKLPNIPLNGIKSLFSLFFILFSIGLFAQNISGTIKDNEGAPIVGASILVKGTSNGTVSDGNGAFILNNVAKGSTLVVSFVGFTTQEINADGSLSITMSEGEALDEVVVTGVFDPRTRMQASVAISTLNSVQLDRIVPTSSVDLLKNMPGVYVNAAKGEVGSSVYTRGLNYNGGFFYVSMQEDGLPVLGISGLVQPDAFLRADATIHRVEVVRGGTASILGPNAPGGLFNYVSKKGGQTLGGEVRTRVGMEGNGKNPYLRGDFNIGGPLSNDKSLTFNVGGFYRNADGPKNPGYKLSYGGQVKANIIKQYSSGSIKVYAKLLDDNTAPFEFTPTVDFANPRTAGAFNNTSSTLIQSLEYTIPKASTGLDRDIVYNTKKGQAFNELAAGFSWEQRFGEGWTFSNNFRVSNKDVSTQTTAVVFPFRVDQLTFYGVSGNVGRFGTYEFYDPTSGKSYGTVQQLPPTAPGPPRVIPGTLTLPGGDVMQNALFYNPNPYGENGMNDVMNQATITKKLSNMTFTGGLYTVSTKATRVSLIPAAQTFATVEDKPKTVAIRYTNLAGVKHDLTNKQGIMNVGGGGLYVNNATINQTAFFLGHNWDVNEKLNIDWGIRAENFRIQSDFTTPKRGTDSKLGLDGDSLTLYDSRVFTRNPEQKFDKKLPMDSVFSYSLGVNYKISNEFAIYGRFSQGRKTPDLSYFMDIANQQLTSGISVEAQNVKMAELGLKFKNDKFSLFATPFYTLASKIPNFQIFQNADATYYAPTRVYQKIRTTGLELEGNASVTKNFSIRAVATFQSSVADSFSVWLANANGPADDKMVSYHGGKNDNIGTMVMITPTYTAGDFFASINYQYMGKRWANVGNAFQLPAFSSLDLNLGYTIGKHIQLNASINNLMNKYGVMSWAAPGGFPASLDTQGFTKAALDANPQANYASLSIMPRAYYLTVAYKF